MRILLGGDFHLGARQGWLGGQAAARREDLNRAFVRFVDFALKTENRVDLVLLLGDLFDHHAPAAPLIDLVRSNVQRLVASGLPVAAIPGTHDGYGYPDSVYRATGWLTGVTLITSPTLSRTTVQAGGGPVHLYGLAYDPGRTPAEPLVGLKRDENAGPGWHIGLVHGSLPASPEWEFRRRDLAIPTSDLAASGLDMLALGHFHNFMERRFGQTVAVYPGTLEGLKWSESGQRSFTVAEVTPAGITMERTPYPGRIILDETLDLTRLGDAEGEIVHRLATWKGLDRIVRLRLTGPAPTGFSIEPLRQPMAEQFFHLEIDDQSLGVDPEWAERLASEPTVRGLFASRLRERIQQSSESDRPLLAAALRLGLAEFAAAEVSHED